MSHYIEPADLAEAEANAADYPTVAVQQCGMGAAKEAAVRLRQSGLFSDAQLADRLDALSTVTPAEVGGLVERLQDVAGFIQKEHGRVAAAACLATEAASLIQSQAAGWAADKARIAELMAVRAYSIEATKAITSLTVGGSEFFGKRIGEMYTADLPYCVEHIKDRERRAHKRWLEEREKRQRAEAQLAEANRAVAALKAENERLTKALADVEAKKISLQDDALPKWINRAEAAERALAERAGGVKVKAELDDDQIMEIIKEVAPWKDEPKFNDLLTHEKSPPLFPQATYDVPSYRATRFVRAVERRILSALTHPAPTHNDGSGEAKTSFMRDCATDGCDKKASVRFERGGVGSDYCHDCYMRVQALRGEVS